MTKQRLSLAISDALARGATLLVPTSQRQAAVRAAWAEQQRAAGQRLWNTPRVLTFTQFARARLDQQWAAANQPDRLLPPEAEWALLRELRREGGGSAEARALLAAARLLGDWRIPQTRAALAGSAEGDLLLEALGALDRQARELDRKPLRAWLDELQAGPGELLCTATHLPTAQRDCLQRLQASVTPRVPVATAVSIAAAHDDEHELELIGEWCRAKLEQDPQARLLIVDANLRQRRRQYERLLSQTLSPSEWLAHRARAFSTYFAIEGGQPLVDFPLIAHALLTLRLLTSSLRFDELVLWLRMPFIDADDLFAGAALEARLREGQKFEYRATELAASLEHAAGAPAVALAARLRQALALLGGESRTPAEWAPRLLAALRAVGWHGSRPLRSDEHQTVVRWSALLDEYSALGAWLPRAGAADAVAVLGELARERSFDPASVDAAVTLTDSHDDPVVRYDGVWVAGLDAAQWPAAPRPDVFVPLRLQVAAGIPFASASGQSRRALASLADWRAASDSLVCSWAELEGDAQRTPSPLLTRLDGRIDYRPPAARRSLASQLRTAQREPLTDVHGLAVNTALPVRGGVRPLTLQAECGFHAYGELRLGARELEEPAPGIDRRTRGQLLHKALELLWSKFDPNFLTVEVSDTLTRLPAIADSVQAAVTHVFRGYVPPELRLAVEREKQRIERLIEALFREEAGRSTFHIESLETTRQVSIAGGTFEMRIDRVDSLQGGGFAILDYKAGESGPLSWDGEKFRNPQLLAYLMAERGRNVQALANISLTRGRARFVGKASRKGLLPGVGGLNANKVPPDQIDAAWQGDVERWLDALRRVAAAYLAGEAPVQPASDVCRHCHLTVLCRRVELAAAEVVEEMDGD
ncbi:MAG TPA: PD-(D/E)XK nuclease family protein [Steroidobacteraceae bacterium]|nr:PD-(D/E)XK nuclease family protein [Steroidobacteraceae bacterium]